LSPAKKRGTQFEEETNIFKESFLPKGVRKKKKERPT
jgi:hypothetical protein